MYFQIFEKETLGQNLTKIQIVDVQIFKGFVLKWQFFVVLPEYAQIQPKDFSLWCNVGANLYPPNFEL